MKNYLDFGLDIVCQSKLPCFRRHNVCCLTALMLWTTHIVSPNVFYTLLRCTFIQIGRLKCKLTNADGPTTFV